MLKWLAVATIALLCARPAAAVTYVVTNTTDINNFACDADCSLREAIYAADATPDDDTIVFDPALFPNLLGTRTIALSGVNITIAGNGALEIVGPVGTRGLGGTADNRVTVSGLNATRLLTVAANAVVTIRRINFVDGNGIGSVVLYQGGAIFNTGTLTLDTVLITESTADNGGGVASLSIGVPATLTLLNSVITANSATTGGGVYSAGTLTIRNSTLSNNSAAGDGGGAWVWGPATLTNVTVVNNSTSGSGGGLGFSCDAAQALVHATIVGNTAAGGGGGLWCASSIGSLSLVNSILWRNGDATRPDVRTTLPTGLVSLGRNLVGVRGTSEGWHATDRFGVDPMLAPLANNGAGLQSMMPLPGSPAIDRGLNCAAALGCSGSPQVTATSDARGIARPIGPVVDIGALEREDTGRMTRLRFDANALDDLVVDFGSLEGTGNPQRGLQMLANNTTWVSMGGGPVVDALLSADVTGDGLDELFLDLADAGIYVLRPGIGWQQLHPISPRTMTSGNIDGVGGRDLVVDFGAPYGIWIYKNDSTWVPLHLTSAVSITTGDLDGSGRDEVIVDFGSLYGTWIWRNDSSWEALHNFSPQSMLTADLDGSGRAEAVIDFGPPYGIWIRWNDTSWQQLHMVSPDTMVVGDIDGNGQTDLAIDFGNAYGIWLWMNNSSWQPLHAVSPESMITADMDGSGRSELVVDFGAQFGVWAWRNNTSWAPLSALSP